MKISNFDFKSQNKTFIIAELSANHNQDIEIAKKTISAIKKSGANCVKFQTYTPDTLTIDSKKDDFIIRGSIWDGKSYYELYKEAYTPWNWHEELFAYAKKEGLICFSSPFDNTAVDLLEELKTPAFKISSFEITDIPLIEYAASKGKPIIFSTGIASLDDIQLALDTCKKVGNNQIILLKCTSSYPAPIEEANLRMIKKYSDDFNVITGLSDHTLGYLCPIIAVSLGARVIEKHFILDRSLGGPDSSFSMNPEEFSEMVEKIRDVEKSLGKQNYDLTDKQIKGKIFSRSLYVTRDISKGEIFDNSNVRSIRPGYGAHPKFLKDILGNTSKVNIKKGSRFEMKFLKK
ncbi:MAG: pseudaminic acid synthase [Flavobacteriaceae bacterium TMED179]|nr:MAG: pseudaminic acid synthase [Flavobacteriaceae bacterium TMED179]|tara:strand:+ start:447 stop:1487 length:1041 start_codon:yes stop_codon:yes gene_type:complete